MSMPSSKRFLSTIGCLLLVLSVSFAPFPHITQEARAQVPLPVIETNPILLSGVVTTASAATVSASSDTTQLFIKQVLDGLAWTVAKTAIQSLTRSTVNWINSGFQGSPAFVTDLNDNLQQLSDAVADDFFSSLERNTGVDVRSPFQDQITQVLRDNYYRSTSGFYGGGYNLNQYSNDPQGFVNGHFEQGGFDAWFAALSNDQNTPLGAYHSAQNELASRIENFRQNRLNELTWGKGFLSWRGDCIAATNASGAKRTAVDQAEPVALAKTDKCLQYEIKTPGSVIESTLGITATSPLRQLELADSINEIVGALAGQLVSQVLGGTGLSGVSQASSGGGSSYLNRATDPAQYAQSNSSLSSGFIQNVSDERAKTQTYQSNWLKIQTAAQNAPGCVSAADAQARATASLAKATQAFSALDAISAKITAAQSSSNATTALTGIATDYQNLVSSGTLLSAQDVALAQQESSPAASGSTSLYTTLTSCAGS